jgi:hypothetical protein
MKPAIPPCGAMLKGGIHEKAVGGAIADLEAEFAFLRIQFLILAAVQAALSGGG